MKDLHLIVVGKLSDKHIEELEKDYFKRITQPKLIIHELKAYSEDLLKESKDVCAKIDELTKNDSAFIVLLAEYGTTFNSIDFSKWLNLKCESQNIIFVIGGAAGHGESVIKRAQFKLSLSEMTLPHKLARLLFVEQVYRAQTIRQNHPYNK